MNVYILINIDDQETKRILSVHKTLTDAHSEVQQIQRNYRYGFNNIEIEIWTVQ